MHSTFQRIFNLCAGLWVGSFITVGFLVTPILFSALGDRQVAGMIAGVLFKIEANINVGLSLALMLLANYFVRCGLTQFRMIRWILLGMLACAIGAAFILIPWMSSLKDQAMLAGLSVMESSWADVFNRLHQASSILYVIQSLLGITLVWRLTGK